MNPSKSNTTIPKYKISDKNNGDKDAELDPDIYSDEEDDEDDDEEDDDDIDEIEEILREDAVASVEDDEDEDDEDDEEEEDDEDDEDDETVNKNKKSLSKKNKIDDSASVNPSSLFPNEINTYEFNDFNENGDSDDESEDEPYLQRIDKEYKKKLITEYHPELNMHNVEEIDAMVKIVRDENGIIVDPLHKTLPFVTKYEKARVIGERAKQINSGAKPFINVEKNIIDGYIIALEEFEQKKIPFIIKRPLPFSGVEYWRLCDLEIL